jgi:hypothetical protein
MKAVIARIVLRYIAAALVAYGILTIDMEYTVANDADLQIGIEVVVGLGIGAVTEAWYAIARRFGWAT